MTVRIIILIALLVPLYCIAETISVTVTGPSQQLNVVNESTVITPETVTVNAVIESTGTEVVTVGVPGPQGIQGIQGIQGLPGTGEGGDVTGKLDTIVFTAYTSVGRITGSDPRLTDARTPTTHGHASGEVSGLATVATSGSYADLSNKPTIPAAQVNSDWNSSSGVSQILNKPTLATVATSGSYSDLSGKPTIPDNATQIAYNNPTYTTVGAALDQLLYISTAITSYTMSGSSSNVSQEIGSTYTITGSGLVWATNKTSLTYQRINSVDRTSPYMPSPSSLTSNTTYTLTVSDGTSNASASRSVTFYARNHWGVSTATSLSSADILTLASNEYATSHSKSVTYDCTGGRYPYFAYPASYGLLTATTVGGLSFSDFTTSTVSHTNASGYTQNYYVVRFNSLQTGSAINVVWH